VKRALFHGLILASCLLAAGCNDFPELEAPVDGGGAGAPSSGGGDRPSAGGGSGTGSDVRRGPAPPWTFAAGSEEDQSKTPEEEAAKREANPTAVAYIEQYGDPTLVVDEDIQRLATIALLSWNRQGAEVDQLLSQFGLTRAQAQAGYRALADDTLRSLGYQHTLRHYQQLQLEGEFAPEVPYEGTAASLFGSSSAAPAAQESSAEKSEETEAEASKPGEEPAEGSSGE